MTDTLQSNARTASTPDVLGKIREETTNLCIWERSPIAGLDALIQSDPNVVRFGSSLTDFAARLTVELAANDYPDLPEKSKLATDIVDLARRFCGILDLDALDLRLEAVTTDSCRKFHADYVKARLITTYWGAGTQWLDSADAMRVRQGNDPVRPHQLGAGDVGLFKGKLATSNPVIHRSPPIAGTGQKRLLLVLNPPANV